MTRKEINQVMSKVKVITTALVAVVAFSALGAATASADWFVGGAKLLGSAPLASKAAVDAPTTLLVPALALSILCKGKFLDGETPEIRAGNLGFAKSLKFLECNTTAPANGTCELKEKPTQTIPTLPILARASLGVGEEVKVLFAPETKNTFAEIEFSEANTCSFAGVEPVKGEVLAGAPTGQLELATQSLVGLGSTENNSLEIGGGNKAFLDGGNALLTLASGSKWSFK